MKEKLKWFRLILVLPLAALLVATNYYEDPANIFHNNGVEIADAIMDGKEAYFGTKNGDERGVKKRIIETMPKNIECLTLGPSLSLGIRSSGVGTDSYYNLSVSKSNFYDFMGEFGLLEVNGVHADRIIFCVDSYFFDESRYKNGSKSPEMNDYAQYMMDFLDGKDPEAPAETDPAAERRIQIEQALSITYFQSCVDMIKSNGSVKLPEKRWGIMDETTQDLAHFLPDASWVYEKEYRDLTEADVLKAAEEYDTVTYLGKDLHPNERSKYYFDKLMAYLTAKGTDVTFFLCPLSPALYDRWQAIPWNYQYYMLPEVEEFARDVAERYGIKVTGSYDPYKVGVSNADFWDSRHMRHDRLDAYFDFK